MPIDLTNPQDANWLARGRKREDSGEDREEHRQADYSNNGVIRPDEETDGEDDG